MTTDLSQENEGVAPIAAPVAAAPTEPRAATPRVDIDESTAQACYANFCRVHGTPEELIIDFGLNSQPFNVPDKPLQIRQRLVVNYFTAKRLLAALQISVQRHEDAFGVLETNVQKRVIASALRSGV
jgi:hypothetical protein